MYAAHKAAGGITSVYRQVGIGCQRIFHQMLQDYLGLSPEEATWSYVVGTRKLSLDGRIETDDVKKPEVKERIREWMEGAGRIANLPEHTLDLIKIYFDFRNDFCVSVEFGSYAARNMFP